MKNNIRFLKLVLPAICFISISVHLSAQSNAAAPFIYSVKIQGDADNAVWKRIMRLFSDRDIAISTIDRNSGFILSGTVSFINAYAIDSVPALGDSTAYVIAQKYFVGKNLEQPSYITGQVKIFVLSDSSTTECRVSIDGLKDYDLDSYYHRSGDVTYNELDRSVRSTGLLEKQVANYIAGKTNDVNINLVKGVVINPKANRYTLLRGNVKTAAIALSVSGAGIFVALSAVGIYEATKGKK